VSSKAGVNRIRALIVDDEPLARSNLAVLLRRDPEVEIVGECGAGLDAVLKIRNQKPDLVLLDVQMPECDGFDVLELLGVDVPPALVFVTAYDQYALRAFEAGALDYLLKPFDNERFERMLRRAKDQIAKTKGQLHFLERLAIKSPGQLIFIKIAEVDWIEAADYYASLHVGPKAHLLRRSLVELEKELDPAQFCRIHRSTIVNLERIRGLEFSAEGEYEVLLENSARLRVSRRYRNNLKARLKLGVQSAQHP